MTVEVSYPPLLVPTSRMEAPITGSPVLSMTVHFTVCADKLATNANKNAISANLKLFVLPDIHFGLINIK